MVIRYWHPPEDDFGGPANRALDDGSDWTASMYLRSVAVGLAAIAAVGSSSAAAASAIQQYEQNEMVVAPAAPQVEEEYWWTRPTVAPQTSRIAVADDDVPAGSLFGQPDEDYWQNPVPPLRYDQTWPQQWKFDEQEPGGLHRQFDEDHWTLWAIWPVQLPPAAFLQIDDDLPQFVAPFPPEDDTLWLIIIRGEVARRGGTAEPPPPPISVEEEYWQNRVSWGDEVTLIAPWSYDSDQAVPTQVDEETWQAPLIWPNAQIAPPSWILDQQDRPSPGLPEEDYWQPLVQPTVASFVWPQYWQLDEQPPQELPVAYDEYDWHPGYVAAIRNSYMPLWLGLDDVAGLVPVVSQVFTIPWESCHGLSFTLPDVVPVAGCVDQPSATTFGRDTPSEPVC